MTYLDDLKIQEAKQAAEDREQRNRQAWNLILENYDDLSGIEANYSLIKSYCNGDITLDRFEFLCANPKPGFALAWRPDRDRLLDAICDLIEDPTGRRMTSHDLKVKRNLMQYWRTNQLRAELARLLAKRKLAEGDNAKKFLAEVRAKENSFGYRDSRGVLYPKLLSTITPPGQVTSVPTPQYLRECAKRDLYTFKKMCQTYSSEQITRMMNS